MSPGQFLSGEKQVGHTDDFVTRGLHSHQMAEIPQMHFTWGLCFLTQNYGCARLWLKITVEIHI